MRVFVKTAGPAVHLSSSKTQLPDGDTIRSSTRWPRILLSLFVLLVSAVPGYSTRLVQGDL
jgi:hypothetical protein